MKCGGNVAQDVAMRKQKRPANPLATPQAQTIGEPLGALFVIPGNFGTVVLYALRRLVPAFPRISCGAPSGRHFVFTPKWVARGADLGYRRSYAVLGRKRGVVKFNASFIRRRRKGVFVARQFVRHGAFPNRLNFVIGKRIDERRGQRFAKLIKLKSGQTRKVGIAKVGIALLLKENVVESIVPPFKGEDQRAVIAARPDLSIAKARKSPVNTSTG